jgi:polyisoprenyl-teichoic acid--peptidoglycan teichoic acid transferase
MNARSLIRRCGKLAALAAVLAGTFVIVPGPSAAPAQSVLVKVDQAHGVDLSPDVVWILALGSDARPGEKIVKSRADAIQLVGINTKTGAAAAIGVPRDSYVPITGVGSERINASLYYGGPQLMANSIRNLIGIEPDYVVVTGFSGLINMVNDIGGITVDNPVAFSDENLAPQGFPQGRVKLNGFEAMAFSRTRHSLLRGDFDRSANQQRTLMGILKKIRKRHDQPGFIEMGVRTVIGHTDTNLSPAELFKLAQAVAQVDPAKVTDCVVQGGIGNVGGASVVLPDRALATRLGNEARKDATLERC